MRMKLEALRRSGNETTGVVTDVGTADDPRMIRYHFDVDGASYAGEMRVVQQFAERYAPGESTPVAYLAADPAVSVPRAKREIDESFIAGTTDADFLRATLLGAAVTIAFCTLLAAALRQRRLLRDGNIIAGVIVGVDAPRVRYDFTTPAGETFARTTRMRGVAAGERVDVCWMPGRPEKSRLRAQLRFVRVIE
jgi:hypothetical protein